MEGGGKQRRFTVLAGLYDHDFIGEIFRLLLRYSHLCKIAGDYLFQKKNCSEYLPGEVWALKGDEGSLCVSMHLFE